MRSRMQKKKELSEEQLEIVEAKDFFDRISPGCLLPQPQQHKLTNSPNGMT